MRGSRMGNLIAAKGIVSRTDAMAYEPGLDGTLPSVSEDWRREWDSNPRYGCPYTRFPSVRLQPLGHPSGMRRGGTIEGSGCSASLGARALVLLPQLP
jgi:hypothetical protein